MANNLPDWYAQMQQQDAARAAPVPAPAARPDWLQKMDADEAARTPAPVAPTGDWGAAKNFITGVAKIPGAILGGATLPGHFMDYLANKVGNAVHGTNNTTEQYIAQLDPIQHSLEKGAQLATDLPFMATGTKPYEPESLGGKLGQAFVTGAGAALADPLAAGGEIKTGLGLLKTLAQRAPSAAKAGTAATAAEGSQILFPDTPGLAATAAILTHGGLSAGAPLVAKGYRTFAAPLVQSGKTASLDAGSHLAGIENTQAGIDISTPEGAALARKATLDAQKDIGDGLDDVTAGNQLRDVLQSRSDALKAARGEKGDENYGIFKEQPPMPGAELAPLMSSPAFRTAIKKASEGRLNRGQSPLTDYFHFRPEDAGEPMIIPNAAVPPDALHRIKGALDDLVTGAKGNTERGDLENLRGRFINALDSRYPQTYPSARGDFQAMSRPLDPLETGPSGRVLQADYNYGNRIYTMPDERVVDTFMRGPTESNLRNLVSAAGGERGRAMAIIEQNLAGKVQSALNADGSINPNLFRQQVKPYANAINMYFPETAGKFRTMEAAQNSLDTITAQRGLGRSIMGGEMRDGDSVTGSSMKKWINANRDILEKTQGKSAVMRLEQIAKAIPEVPGGAAETTLEAAPMVIGGAAGGLEGGVLGGITHKIPGYFGGRLLTRYRKAYSDLIENAVLDPHRAQVLINAAVKRGGTKSLSELIKAQALTSARNVLASDAAGGGLPQSP